MFEARTLIWMCENILTHSESHAVGIDNLSLNKNSMKNNIEHNIHVSGYHKKIAMRYGDSFTSLLQMEENSFDIIYVDGNHDAIEVLKDALSAWRLLKPNGILMFDDYKMGSGKLPVEERPKMSIDAFLQLYRKNLKVLHKSYQVIVKKV